MFIDSHVLFKQFLPKEMDLRRQKTHQTINLQSISKQLQNLPKNNSLSLFKQTIQPNQPAQFSKPFLKQQYSSKKVPKLKKRGNINNIIQTKITKNTSRSQLQFMDDNIWKNLTQTKTKKFEDLIKDISSKLNRPHMTIIFKTNKEIIGKNRQNEVDYVKCNIITLRKIVRSQSQQRNNFQLMRLNLFQSRKGQIKSKVFKQQLHEQLLRKQQKNDLKLKMLTKLVQNNPSSRKLMIKEINKRYRKINPQTYLNLTDIPLDLKANKVIFQRKNSLKKQIIDKIRKQRASKHNFVQKQSLKNTKYVSSYLTQGTQQKTNHNFSFCAKRRIKSEHSQHSESNHYIINQTQNFVKNKTKQDDLIGQAIQPW